MLVLLVFYGVQGIWLKNWCQLIALNILQSNLKFINYNIVQFIVKDCGIFFLPIDPVSKVNFNATLNEFFNV